MTITRQTYEKYLALAFKDYETHLGKYLEVDYVCGYNANDDSGEWTLDPPVIVQLTKTPAQDLEHTNDEYLDPYWDIRLVSGKLPEGIRSIWIDGPSYNMATGERLFRHVRVLGPFEQSIMSVKDSLRKLIGGRC